MDTALESETSSFGVSSILSSLVDLTDTLWRGFHVFVLCNSDKVPAKM